MKKVLLGLLIAIVVVVAFILYYFKADTNNAYEHINWGRFGSTSGQQSPNHDFDKDFAACDYSVPTSEIPVFKNIDFNSNNVFDNKRSLPWIGTALIDLDNDGIDEVFVAGGVTQEDAIWKYDNGNFKEVTMEVGLPKKPVGTTTLGAVSFDLDANGYTDLLLTGDYGILWYQNMGDSIFEVKKINTPLDEKSEANSITLGDVNRDGFADIFLSAYIKLDKMEGQTIFKDLNYGASSLLLMNNGDNTFRDGTVEMGLSYIHNTFCAVFVDVDKDSYLDLVVAHDTGEVRTYKNNEGSGFTKKDNPTTGKYSYPMGIAVGDYNNDGNIDFFFSNTGSSVPKFLARGDLAEEDEFISNWMLFRNDGNFQFTDVADETKVADFEFSWGAIFEDFNLDGRQDLVVAENYVDFPPHKLFKLPCRFLVQRPDGTFASVEEQAKVINKNYAITPLTSDFNQDGYPDLIYANISGPMKASINEGGDANFITVRLPETAKYVGSQVIVNKTDGSLLSDVYVVGEGLVSDQTSALTFGLGNVEEISSLEILLPDGTKQMIENPEINKIHRLSF